MRFPIFGLEWASRSLYRKFLAGTASGLILMSAAFFLIFIAMYRAQLEAERVNASTQMNQLLQATLENAMVKRDLDGLRDIVRQLGRQEEIRGTYILNTQGEVRFASDPGLLGGLYPDLGDHKDGGTEFMLNEKGAEILRSVNPVYNKPRCVECHGAVDESPINGIMVVDYDASIIRAHARRTTVILMSSGAIIVLITLVGSWWFFRHQVQEPVRRLVTAQRHFMEGDMDTRIRDCRPDEVGELSASFNRMAARIAENFSESRRREQFLQSLIDGIPDGIRVIDDDYRIVAANKAYLQHTGGNIENTIRQPCFAGPYGRTTPCPATLITCPLRAIRESRRPVKVIHRNMRADGTEVGVEIFAAPVFTDESNEEARFIVEVVRDLSRAINYSHQQRLSSLGELAAGVAHEIYNPLGSIKIALQSLLHEAATDIVDQRSIREYLVLVEDEIEKCIEVTGRLLKLSVASGDNGQLLETNAIIRDTLSLLKWEGENRNIQVFLELQEPGPRIVGNDGELRMAILNIIQNAFHAMPDGGQLTVRTHTRDGTAVMEFQDTGVGIAPDALERIFDPFFSVRADNVAGTGLGLAITEAIVKRLSGAIRARSSPGMGATFTIEIPEAGATHSQS